jgi:hypothetical protein
MDQAETLLMRAVESGQFSAAVSALREKAVLSGHRVEFLLPDGKTRGSRRATRQLRIRARSAPGQVERAAR